MKALLEDTICLKKMKVLYVCLFLASLFVSVFCLFLFFKPQNSTTGSLYTPSSRASYSLEKPTLSTEQQPNQQHLQQFLPAQNQQSKNLALKPHCFPLFFPDLKKEIHVALKNSRPDTSPNQRPLVLMLQSSKEKKIINNQECIFLNPPQTNHDKKSEQDKKFHFSLTPTPIALHATWIEPQKVHIQLAIDKEKFPNVIFPKKFTSEFILEPEEPKESLEKEEFFLSLAATKWWGKDALVSTFFPEQEEQQRLEVSKASFLKNAASATTETKIATPTLTPFPTVSSSMTKSEGPDAPGVADTAIAKEISIATDKAASSTTAEGSPLSIKEFFPSTLLIKEKDYLIWKNSFWQKISSLEKANGYPLAQIVSIQPEHLEVFLWDATGENFGKIVLPLQPSTPIKKEETVLTEIHLRSKNQLSVKIEKQRVLLKVKNFVYRKSGRWKVTKKIPFSEPFDKLFFLDKIQEEAEGKSIIGYFFDASHTQKEEIKIFVPSPHPKRALQKSRFKSQKAFSSKKFFSEVFSS